MTRNHVKSYYRSIPHKGTATSYLLHSYQNPIKSATDFAQECPKKGQERTDQRRSGGCGNHVLVRT